MKDIDEAIRHAEEVAEKNERMCRVVHPAAQLSDYGKCAKEHRQLAEWLKELKRYREAWDKIKTELNELIEWHDTPIEIDNGNDVWYCTAIGMALTIIDKALGEVEQDV